MGWFVEGRSEWTRVSRALIEDDGRELDDARRRDGVPSLEIT
jgi:hypothetical protein